MSNELTARFRDRQQDHLAPQRLSELELYLNTFDAVYKWPRGSNAISHASRIGQILERHERVIDQFLSPGFIHWTAAAKDLTPNVAEGKFACIDGREDQRIQDGAVFKRWSAPGAVLTLTSHEGRQMIAAGRLHTSLYRIGTSGDELLELHKGHTSLSSPRRHGCAAVMAMVAEAHEGQIPEQIDLIDYNLQRLREQEETITNAYNAGRKAVGLAKLPKVVVHGISDTDTLGLLLRGNEEDSVLSTIDLAERTHEDLLPILARRFGENYGRLGFLRNTYTDPSSIALLEEMNYHIVSHLMEYKPFTRAVDRYVQSSNLAKLTEAQRRSLLYIIGRNLANQYLLGLFLERHNPNHLHSQHREDHAGISPDAIHIGQLDPGTQSLKANPDNYHAASEHALIQHAVMRDHRDKKPHIIFVSSAVPLNVGEDAYNSSRGNNYNWFMHLVQDTRLASLIKAGEIIFIPILMSEDRRIVEIPNQLAG